MSTPPQPVETRTQLKKSGQVILDGSGNGMLTFDPDNARQRWEVTSVICSTNQPATSTVIPVCTLALNTTALSTMSQGNQRGASWSGNQDTFAGLIDVGPCDFLSAIFSPPPGTPGGGAALAGVIASAVLTGSKFTRRA